jgi:N-sulfoglucosamine sulfohydrolase
MIRLGLLFFAFSAGAASGETSRPNILFCISDDQSWPHASAYGEPVIQTPAFDRVASEGVLFNKAYCAAPSCTPSRSAILTGQDIWRIGEGGQLFGTLPAAHPIYTDLLAASGYHVGYIRKGWAPGNITAGGRSSNGAGTKYDDFPTFFESVPQGNPWCFWFGSTDPHRGYNKGSGVASGMDPSQVRVPGFLPDTPETRSDLCDYFFEIQRFDQEIAAMLATIEAAGQLDNTLVVITSDNGLPFPRGKATLYDAGTRMPLAIRWPDGIPTAGRTVDDFVNLTDLAPTFLEAAGLAVPDVMTGRSLMELLASSESGMITAERDAVVTARERHAYCRIDGAGYPSRMIRTANYLYVRNYEPDRWPAGDYRVVTNEGNYGDVDASPSKNDLFARIHEYPALYKLAFGKRPAEELYDCVADPDQLQNLAEDPNYSQVLQELSNRLTAHLQASGDPREVPDGEVLWDSYPYYGRSNWDVLPDPHVTGLTASIGPDGVLLEWVNQMDYAEIEIRRDGLVIEAALPGQSTSYEDLDSPTSGFATYTVTPVTGSNTPAEIVVNFTPDNTPPPVPEWVTPLGPVTATEITLAAIPVVDGEGNGVEYRFFNHTLATNSGWLSTPTWTHQGLSPGTTYRFTVQARDTSANRNESAVSSPESATTLASVGVVIHVPFDGAPGDPIVGTTPTGLGAIVSHDSTTDNVVLAGSLAYGLLPASGNKYSNAGGRADFSAATTGLTGSGLLDNGSSLWMSVVVTPLTSSSARRFQVLLGTEHAAPRTLEIENSGDAVGIFWNNGDDLQVLAYEGGARSNANVATNRTLGEPVLVVMEMVWSADGTSDDTFRFYLPGTDLAQPAAAAASFSYDMDNTAFDTMFFGALNALAYEADEIRVGASYEDVIGAGGGDSAYTIWAATNAPTTGSDLSADEDGDGVGNGVEFIVGGSGSTHDLDKLPTASTAGANMTFSFERAQQSIDPSTTVSIEVGTDLTSWPDVYAVPDDATAAPPVTVVKDSAPGVDTVTLGLPMGPGSRKFARLKVTISP